MNRYISYLRRCGLDTVSQKYYNMINKWESWYRGSVATFHRYKVYVGKGHYVPCRRRTMNMAKKLCEDMADMLMNERVKIAVESGATDEYVQSVFDACNFQARINEYQERKAATGTTAYVPYLVGAVTDAEGKILSARVKIMYCTASRIFPIHWENGNIISCAFAMETTWRGKSYGMIQRHELEDGQYVIRTAFLKGARGTELTEAERERIPAFRDVVPYLETGSDQPLFAIDRLAIVNNASSDRISGAEVDLSELDGGRDIGALGSYLVDDSNNPLGIPIFANSVPTLESLDIEYDSYANEFVLGRKRLMVAPEMLIDENGNYAFDPNEGIFYLMPEDSLNNGNEAIHDVDMKLRVEEHEKAINHNLNLLSLKAGLGTQYYRFERGSVATATQVISENSDLYRTIKKHEIPLESALRTLIRAIIAMGTAAGVTGLDPDADIKVFFDDSIIEDKATEREQDRKDVDMGAMSLVEYRAKWYGETKEDAEKNLPKKEVQQA